MKKVISLLALVGAVTSALAIGVMLDAGLPLKSAVGVVACVVIGLVFILPSSGILNGFRLESDKINYRKELREQARQAAKNGQIIR